MISFWHLTLSAAAFGQLNANQVKEATHRHQLASWLMACEASVAELLDARLLHHCLLEDSFFGFMSSANANQCLEQYCQATKLDSAMLVRFSTPTTADPKPHFSIDLVRLSDVGNKHYCVPVHFTYDQRSKSITYSYKGSIGFSTLAAATKHVGECLKMSTIDRYVAIQLSEAASRSATQVQSQPSTAHPATYSAAVRSNISYSSNNVQSAAARPQHTASVAVAKPTAAPVASSKPTAAASKPAAPTAASKKNSPPTSPAKTTPAKANPSKPVAAAAAPKATVQGRAPKPAAAYKKAASTSAPAAEIADDTAEVVKARFPGSSRLDVKKGKLVDNMESQILEFKSQYSVNEHTGDWRDLICRYGCGFLNTRGGTLLIGVEDNGVVTGLDWDRATVDDLMCLVDGAFAKQFSPQVDTAYYCFDIHKHNQRIVLAVHFACMASDDKTVFQYRKKAYSRGGASLHIMSDETVQHRRKHGRPTIAPSEE